jgi:threonine dehydratase
VNALDAVVDLIPSARAAISSQLLNTEVRELNWLTPYAGRKVVAKLENQQITGSFKARGALFALAGLPPGTSVIAPSAGNHGLAVAWAAARLGLIAEIVLPENASPLKRERILLLGAGVIEAGSTVDDASVEATRMADEGGHLLLSPFDNLHMMAGAATAFVEFLEAIPDLRSILVPVGGGGLLAGALAARVHLDRQLTVVACEPTAFASLAATVTTGAPVRLGRRPTFADGLALNVNAGSRTAGIAAEAQDVVFCSFSEEEIAAGSTALFNRESLLVEGAGAIGVPAAIRATELGLPEGPTGTVICGGNVHHTTFWQMTSFDLQDPRLAAVADTMGRTVDAETERHSRLFPVATGWGSGTQKAPEAEIASGIPETSREMLSGIARYATRTDELLDDLEILAAEHGLPLDRLAVNVARSVNQQVADNCVIGETSEAGDGEQRVRALSQLAVASRMAFEWRSPAYDQAGAVAALDPGALGSPGVNYARYAQPGVAEVERQLAEIARIDPATHAVLLTSSGMAAFGLIMGMLLERDGVRTAITAPYLYFEAHEMLRYWLGPALESARTFDAREIAEQAVTKCHDAVFADPMANNADQRMVDVEWLAAALSSADRPPWLVVDGTMLPVITAMPVTTALPEKALYYESCSKYLQLGLDIAMAGMVVVPRRLEARARRVRRNLGLGVDRYGAELFPRYRAPLFIRRLQHMERAAADVAVSLRAALPEKEFTVGFPGLPEHPDHLLAQRMHRTGSCLTVAPVRGHPSRDQLEPVVDEAIRVAQRRGVSLVKGVSFGFTVSRISSASAMAEGTPPFMRLAVGLADPGASRALADVLSCAILAVWHREPLAGGR